MGLPLVFQDDVMGTSSELSLSCISLSGEWIKGMTASFNRNSSLYMFYSFVVFGVNEGEWQEIAGRSSEQPFSTGYPHIPSTPGAASFQALVCVCPLFFPVRLLSKWSFSRPPHLSIMPDILVSLSLLFSFSQRHAHHVFLGYLRAMSSQLELQKAFFLLPRPKHSTHIYPCSPPSEVLTIFGSQEMMAEKTFFFFFFNCQQSFQGNCVSSSSSSRDAFYTDLRESHTNREKNQLKTNVSHQQTPAELGTVCQTRRGNERKLVTALRSRVFRPDADRCQNYTRRKRR